ncbi:alpha/beta hydrolase family protein [Agromyces protaetiae]|uniref:alpha/beta hydrolase family protein n=1 Tax=Agromyces protaetiae TaxID=2509455 RepID=UPI001FB57E31|nr:hypothetical protein [Agromyces protaetiae]
MDGALVEPDLPGIVIALNPAPVDLSFALEESGLLEATGAPTLSPEDLEGLEAGSALPFFGRAHAPLVIVHGSADDLIPVSWSQRTVDAWNAAGPRADLVVVDGADHGLEPHLQEVAGIVVGAAMSALG